MILKPFDERKITNAKTDKERSGYLNEKQTAYLIDFEFKDYKKAIVLHDVRFEYNGRTAQIDHLVIDQGFILVIESKFFSGHLEISDDSWIVDYGKAKYSIPSPIQQNKRHIAVLAEIIKKEGVFPKVRIEPYFVNAVVVSNKTIINGARPAELVYADVFVDWAKKARWKTLLGNPFKIMKHVLMLNDVMSEDEVLGSVRRLMKFCTNCTPDAHYEPEKTSKVVSGDTAKTIPLPAKPIGEDVSSLMEEMKQLRIELAKEYNAVMLHHVFGDQTLEEFDAKRPSTKEEMLKISGVGEVKYERYGTRFMELWSNKAQTPATDAEFKKSDVPVCQKCGAPMVFHNGKKGRSDFFGCSTYPKCKFTVIAGQK